MGKRILFFILVTIVISGCAKKQKKEKQPMIQEEVVTKEPKPTEIVDAERKGTLSLDECAALIGKSKDEVFSLVENDYVMQDIGISKLDVGYYFETMKVAFFFNQEERLQYIEYRGLSPFLSKTAGSNFESIQKEYGTTDVVTYEIIHDSSNLNQMVRENWGDDGDIRYEISYLVSDYLISFVSRNESGSEYTTYIYKPVGFLTEEEITKLLDYDTTKIRNRFGKDGIVSGIKDELFPDCITYRALGLTFGTNRDEVEEDWFVQFAPYIEFRLVHAGMKFDEVMQVLGDSYLIKEERYMLGCSEHTIEYRDDYCLSFEAKDAEDKNSIMQIAKMREGYRDKIVSGVKWNIYQDNIGFEYQGSEYLLGIDPSSSVFPIYDSVVYEKYKVPQEALGACYLCDYSSGEIMSFYVAFDEDWRLNLYVNRDAAEPCQLERVLFDESKEEYKPYEILDTNVEEVPVEEITQEEQKVIEEINQTLQNHQLYTFFEIEDSCNWPEIKEDCIRYDFNADGKLEELRVRYYYGVPSSDYYNPPYKDVVIELTLGKSKLLIRRDPDYGGFSVGICDIDTSDHKVEIFTTGYDYYEGESFLFYLNEDKLEEAVTLDYHEQLSGVSGDGKIYLYNGLFRNPIFDGEKLEDFVLWYKEYPFGEIVSTNQIIGKQYLSFCDIIFEHQGNIPYSYPFGMWNEGAIYEMKNSEICTVIDKDDSCQAIKVRTEDGIEGWIGGYHGSCP